MNIRQILVSIKSIVFPSILYTLYFLLAPSALAQDCNQEPNWKNGLTAYLFDNPQEDCSWDEAANIDEHVVTCVANPDLTATVDPNLIANAKTIYENARNANASVRAVIQSLPNFALDSGLLTDSISSDDPLYTNELLLTSYYLGNNPQLFPAYCQAKNLSSSQCAQITPAANLPSTGTDTFTNLLAISGKNALLSLEEQLKAAKAEQDFSRACATNPDSDPNCYNTYYINDQDKNTAVNIPTEIEDIRSTNSNDLQKALAAGQPKKTLKKAHLCISRNISLQADGNVFSGIFFSIIPNDTVCQEIPVPGLVGAVDQAINELMLTTSPGRSRQIIDQAYEHCGSINAGAATTTLPPARDDIYQNVVTKIEQAGNSCTLTDNASEQFTGARIEVVTEPSFWSTDFGELLTGNLLDGDSIYTYSAWLVQPIEACILQQVTNAMGRSSFSLNYASYFDQEVYSPYSSGDAPQAQGEATVGITEICQTDTDTGVTDCQDRPIVATLSSGANALAKWFGGELANLWNRSHQYLFPLSDPNRFQSDCFYTNLTDQNQSLASKLGNPDLSSTGPCPEAPKKAAKTLAKNACDSGQSPPIQSAGPTCQLCETSGLTSYFQRFGYSQLPEDMILIIESAAQEFNVPASLIFGILYGEGGLERWNWAEEFSGDKAVCQQVSGCYDLGKASSEGALGAYQILPFWNENMDGDPCNFYDSTRLIAKNLRDYKGGFPLWFYQENDGGKTSCGGIDYNVSGVSSVPASTCSNWTDKDVVTVTRLHRGLCHEEFQNNVLQFFNCNW